MNKDSRPQTPQTPYFSAVLTPYRSLSPRGFLIVMSVLATVSFIAGFAFFLIGAWPVVGFFGLDLALIYWAFRKNYADARVYETVEVSSTDLVVHRVVKGRVPSIWRVSPYWVRIFLEAPDEIDGYETCGRLILSAHGEQLEIGSFLAPAEKRSFAEALRDAVSMAPAKARLAGA